MLPYSQWLVWIIPLASSLLVPVIAHFGERIRNLFAIFVGLATLVFALSMIPDAYAGARVWYDVSWISTLGVSAGVMVDPLSVLLVNLVAFFSVIISIYSLGYMAGEEGLTRYYFLLLLFIGSMIGLIMSDNFLQMFIFWEMVGMCSYSLVSFWYKRPEAVSAAIKIFLMTRVGDICLLAAISLLYVNLGSFSFSYIMTHMGSVSLQTSTVVAFLILGAAVAKSAQLPMHTWLYSAMQAPTSISALLHGATMVKAGVYLVARLFVLFGPVIPLMPYWLATVAALGTVTAAVAATLALRSDDIKGVAAYSTISQIGFMMAALGTATSVYSEGWFAGLFHLVSHAFFQGLGFMAIGGIVHAVGTRDMRLMGGLRKRMPVTFWLCVIMMLTAAGIPPFASFFSKELILGSMASTGNILLETILYASAAATFAYTLRFIILVFMRDESENVKKTHPHDPPMTMLIPSGILAVLCLAWGLGLGPIGQFMGANVIGIAEFFGQPMLILLVLLSIGGIPVYLAYYKKQASSGLVERLSTPITKVLDRGYFFDEFYELFFVKGLNKVSNALELVEHNVFLPFPKFFSRGPSGIAHGLEYFDKNILLPLPNMGATRVIQVAHGVHRYFDIMVDEAIYFAAHKTLISVSKLDRRGPEYISHYIASALLGFLALSAIIVITMVR